MTDDATPAEGQPARRWTERALGLDPTSPWRAVLVIGVLLAVAWVVVWLTGGTQRAYPHLFYLPIILASLPFGLRGTVTTALAAAVAVGPLMPLDTVTGEPQTAQTWITRAVFFVLVGTVVAVAIRAREQAMVRQLGAEVRSTLQRGVHGVAVDEALLPLLDEVITTEAFHPVYQPFYALGSGELLGVEALTRFDLEPHRPPDVWFATAAAAGRGADLEVSAMAVALRHATELPLGVELSINASPATLADPRLIALVRNAGRPITIEVTEHSVVEDYDGLAERVDTLRALGARIAVDDAGAGISSLRHIVQLAPEVIKLDITLAQQVTTSPLRRALAVTLVDFARTTGAKLLVEGIEQVDDLLTWTHLGADAAQGFLLGRPSALPVPARCRVIAVPTPARFLAGGRSAG